YTPKRKGNSNTPPDPPDPPNPPNPLGPFDPPNPLDPPKPQQDLTDKDGLDMAYANNDDISLLRNTMYVAGTKLNRSSDIYDDITKVPTILNAVPDINMYKLFMC
ncbi:MAG: hypothetical protein ACKPKO_06670, partial [Candidatus Fonsibacter sp.]